jgi:hypothetical protein
LSPWESAQAPPIGNEAQESALGAASRDEQDEWQRKDHDRVVRGPAGPGVGIANEIAHEAEVERASQMAIGVVRGYQLLPRHGGAKHRIALLSPS